MKFWVLLLSMSGAPLSMSGAPYIVSDNPLRGCDEVRPEQFYPAYCRGRRITVANPRDSAVLVKMDCGEHTITEASATIRGHSRVVFEIRTDHITRRGDCTIGLWGPK